MRTRQRGIAITIMLAVISLLSICVMTLGTVSVQALGFAQELQHDKQAWFVAEAGLRDAVRELRNDKSWSMGFTAKSLIANNRHRYTVTVTNNVAGTADVKAPDGTLVEPEYVYILSEGTTEAGETKKVSARCHRQTIFQHAVFGDEFVEYGGNSEIDSWDSRDGTVDYDASRRQDDGSVLVGTNGSQEGAVSGGGSSMTYGSVSSGPGSDPDIAVDADGHYSGTASANGGLPMPEVTPTLSGSGPNLRNPGTVPPGVYGDLKSSQNVKLTSGTYLFNGSVQLSGNCKLEIDSSGGPVIIYVAGTWDSTGSTVANSSKKAWNLQLYGTETCTSVALGGGSQTYMICYAPDADVKAAGTSDFFGSIIGSSVDITGGARVHYDITLMSQGIGPSYWQTTAFHRW